MRLLAPWWLLLLAPVALLALVYVVQHRRRSRYAVRFATLPMLERLVRRPPAWRRHLPASALLLAFGLMALAAARPEVDLRVPQEQATIIVAVDTSRSMEARDVDPSRIEAATEAAAAFITGLPEEFDVGVVAFSRGATVLAPPSRAHAEAADSFAVVPLGNGTAIGEGIFTSLRQIQAFERATGSAGPARVVLLSDGENTVGRSPGEAATAARDAGIPVSTIAYGSPDGAVSDQGFVISTPVDVEALADIADTSGGSAYTAESGDELDAVYDEIQSSIGFRTERREVTPYAVSLALLAGLVAAGLSLRWFARLP